MLMNDFTMPAASTSHMAKSPGHLIRPAASAPHMAIPEGHFDKAGGQGTAYGDMAIPEGHLIAGGHLCSHPSMQPSIQRSS